eukprot:1083129-Pleurochrysis_carterae.AAC.2
MLQTLPIWVANGVMLLNLYYLRGSCACISRRSCMTHLCWIDSALALSRWRNLRQRSDFAPLTAVSTPFLPYLDLGIIAHDLRTAFKVAWHHINLSF